MRKMQKYKVFARGDWVSPEFCRLAGYFLFTAVHSYFLPQVMALGGKA
jgi:hypothetical protein